MINSGVMDLRSGRLALVAALVALTGGEVQIAAQRAATSGPPIPYEDIGACPFEGCVYRDWTANSPVTVLTDRRDGSPVAFTLAKGDHVMAITGIVITTKPGRVRFKNAAEFSSSAGTLRVTPEDTLYLLTYHGEGETTAWFKGRLYDWVDGSEFFNGLCGRRLVCNGTIVEKPESVWWIRLRNMKGLTGWTKEPEKFDNNDRFG